MSDYMPTTDEVCAAYVIAEAMLTIKQSEVSRAEFDRWLAGIRAEALEEAADAWHAENTGTSPRAYNWLRNQAQKIRETQ